MVCCCVPFCKSVQNKDAREKKITFHEFPSNMAMRVKWIQAISRKDPETNNYWMPSQYSCVCSLHFTPDQFKPFLRKKILLPESVPCVFPNYPDYLLQSTAFKRFCSPPSKTLDNTKITNKTKVHSTKNNDVINANKDSVQFPSKKSTKTYLNATKACSNENKDISNTGVNINECDVIKQVHSLKILSSNTDYACKKNVETIHEAANVNAIKESQVESNSFSIIDPSQKLKPFLSENVVNIDLSKQNLVYCNESNDSSTDVNINKCESGKQVHIVKILGSTTGFTGKSNIENIEKATNVNVIGGPLSPMDTDNFSAFDPIQTSLKPSVPENTVINDFSKQKFPISNQSKSSPVKTKKNIKYYKVEKSKELKHNNEILKDLKHKYESSQRIIRRYKAQVLKLKETNQIITGKFKDYNIEELEKGVVDNNTKALFLIEQLHSLTRTNILWSKNTMKFARRLERKFPASYSFLRQTDILNLPSPKILRFNHRIDDDDSDGLST